MHVLAALGNKVRGTGLWVLLEPLITLPKEEFECGEALLSSSSWIYCLAL